MRHAPFTLLLLAACGSPQERDAERALRLGAAAFDEGRFEKADSLYALAPHDARAAFNGGNSAFRLGRWPDAARRFSESMRLDSSAGHAARARFNLAAAHLAEARDADTTIARLHREVGQLRMDGTDIARDVATFVLRDSLQRDLMRLESSIDSAYAAAVRWNKAALRADPSDDDARRNLMIARRAFEARLRAREAARQGDKDSDKEKQLSQRAQLLMQQADSLVEQYRFRNALELLQKGLREDPSLRSKEEYMRKLETVNKAAQAS